MKTIQVVAAIIIRNSAVFATQRGYGDFKGFWEFPGGKIEIGETPQEALKREIFEELNADITIGELFDTIEWDYPTFHLSMRCYLCTLNTDDLQLNEHESSKWLCLDTLRSVKWLPADLTIIDKIESLLSSL